MREREPRGHHDLEELACGVLRDYFPAQAPLPIRWGHRVTRKKRRSIRLGSYNHVTLEIRVHPLLDSAVVPPFFIQSIIHHEYLHHLLGPNHNRRFHQHERKFRHHRQAQAWLKRNLHVLLGRPRRPVARLVSHGKIPAQLNLF